MKILIVGSTGFVGSNFLEFLKRHHEIEVHTLDRNKNSKAGVISHSWENLTGLHLQDVSKVFYFAGKAHDLKKTSNDQVYFDINVGLLRQFVSEAEKQNFKGKLVFLSSVKAIADAVEGELKEDDSPNPITPYGKSKLEAEQLLLESSFKDDTYILRPCMIHGKGNKGNLNQLFSFVKKGIPNILASYTNERSLLSVDNLIFVFYKIIRNELEPSIYQVSDDGLISTNEIMDVIGETIEKNVIKVKTPKFLVGILAKFGDILPLPINSDRLQKLTENYRVSNKKLVEALGEDMPISLKQGLKTTIQSFKE
jgi:nucleoside-diphosphate-sugar epimerase